MTINVQLRKGSVTVVTQDVIERALASRQDGEEVNVIVFDEARVIVLPADATTDERVAAARELL